MKKPTETKEKIIGKVTRAKKDTGQREKRGRGVGPNTVNRSKEQGDGRD